MTDEKPQTGGKGRPTPKRSEARRTRRAPAGPPPRTRREAYRRRREELRVTREARTSAMRKGDEKSLPAYARGPEKAVIRDVVDSRQSFGWLAIPGFLINVASFAVPDPGIRAMVSSFGFACFMMVLIDTFVVVRGIRRALREQFPEGTTERRGTLLRYGIARNTQRRSRRLPPPRVELK